MKTAYRTVARTAPKNTSQRMQGRHQLGYGKNMQNKSFQRPLLREQVGDVLRQIRRAQGRTLREVSADAKVSLGYLSEVERGQKEASSELLVSISEALGVPLSLVLREVANEIAAIEQVDVPESVPAALRDGSLSDRITLLS